MLLKHGLFPNMFLHLTSKNTKILMYTVLIRPVLTYASETWTLSKHVFALDLKKH